MKVLIADKLSKKAVGALEELGTKVTVNADLSADDLPEAIGDSEVLIVRSTRVTDATIEAGKSLSLVIRAGAGVNTIDLEAASSRGIYVANCPGKNTDAVAELAVGHLIAADRRIVDASSDLRCGKWKKKEYQKSRGLKGRTLGIIGLGAIGTEVAKRAKGLEMDVIVYSRSLTEEKAKQIGVGYCKSPEAVAEQADAVSVHLAAKPETKHLIGRKFFEKMKDGAIFINTSRGEVVDTKAMQKAIKEKGLRVGLDVYEDEPTSGTGDFDDTELALMVNGTPHIGASTDQAAEAIADEVVRIIRTYKETGKPVNTVNVQAQSPAKINLVARHYNRVGVLAGILDELRNEGINVEEMENTIFAGGKAACCALKLDDEPSRETVEKIRQMQNIIQVMLK